MEAVELKRRIRWADADAAGRLHFPRIFEYVEEGEAKLMARAGFAQGARRGPYDFPRVHVEATFRRVLALGAPFVMRVAVGQLGHTSIRFDFQVYADEAKQELAVEGSMTVVVVENDKPVEIPAALRAALAPGGNKA